MEYELLDTGVFDEDRYFDVFVEYAKADPEDVLIKISVHNRGPEAAQTSPASHIVVPQHMVVGRRRGEARVAARRANAGILRFSSEAWRLHLAVRGRDRSCCSPKTNRTTAVSGASPIRRRM